MSVVQGSLELIQPGPALVRAAASAGNLSAQGSTGNRKAVQATQHSLFPCSTVFTRQHSTVQEGSDMSAISASQAKAPRVPARQALQHGRPGTPGSEPPLPPLRLTRRGKIVLIGIPLMLLAALLLSLAGFFN